MIKATAKNDIQVDIETIQVEGSDSKVYSGLLRHTPASAGEDKFMKNLKTAIEGGVRNFRVPVCDPSINKKGKLQFKPGCKTAVGYSYKELVKIAEENGIRLGSKNEYCLFLGTMINRLMAAGWSEADAWHAVCTDSTELGHYFNPAYVVDDFERTGSKKVVGKCDLANAYKILAYDKETGGFWHAGGNCNHYGNDSPLATLRFLNYYDGKFYGSVGWFVI